MEGNFTERVRDVILFSREEAIRLGHDYIGTEHLLLGLLREGQGIAVKILRNLGCDPQKLKMALEDTVRSTGGTLTVGNIPLTKQSEKVLKITYLEAKTSKSDVIGTEHLLLSLLRDDENIAAQILQQGFSITYDAVRAELEAIYKGKGTDPSKKGSGAARRDYAQAIVEDYARTVAERGRRETRPHKATRADEYCRDLTQKARLDLEAGRRIVGREKEIEALARVLCMKRKHALLVGDEGVGKTAIVEGLAQAMIDYDVPAALFDHRIVELDVEAILTETPQWFQMEDRMRKIIRSIDNREQVILFIKDLNVFAGRVSVKRQRFLSMLHYVLKRGGLRCIGAASIPRYDGFLRPLVQLERAFQVIPVQPPPDDETLAIVTAHRQRLESRYECTITDEALKAAFELSVLYLPDRRPPGRAVDLLDEAGAWVGYRHARQRGQALKAALADILAQLKKTKTAKESAVQSQQFEDAARLRDEQKEWEQAKADAIEAWHDEETEDVIVDEETVCQALSEMTEIAVEAIRAREAVPAPSAPDEAEGEDDASEKGE